MVLLCLGCPGSLYQSENSYVYCAVPGHRARCFAFSRVPIGLQRDAEPDLSVARSFCTQHEDCGSVQRLRGVQAAVLAAHVSTSLLDPAGTVLCKTYNLVFEKARSIECLFRSFVIGRIVLRCWRIWVRGMLMMCECIDL